MMRSIVGNSTFRAKMMEYFVPPIGVPVILAIGLAIASYLLNWPKVQ